MFYNGSLQEGISQAVQESKSVLCFVTDDGEESNKWEHEWLQDLNIPTSIEHNAIALRLQAGSEEAGFLAAVCPVSEVPTIAIIHQGQLRDQLKAGISKNDFTIRLIQAIRPGQMSNSRPATTQNPANVSSSASPPPPLTDSSARNTSTSPAPSDQASSSTTNPQPPRPSQNPQAPSPQPSPEPPRRSRQTYEQEQAKSKREAKAERARILKEIENDKLERRRREEERKAAAKADADQPILLAQEHPELVSPPSGPPASSPHATANLQVRLPDGSTIRKAFQATSDIKSVRTWINEQSGSSTKYSLKLVLTPLPSRTISDPDDKQNTTLAELGLTPSATLVMVPAPSKGLSFPSSVNPSDVIGSGGQAAGVISNAYNICLAWLIWLFTLISTWLRTPVEKVKIFLGLGEAVEAARASQREGAAPASQSSQANAASSSQAKAQSSGVASSAKPGGFRIRTLRDQRDETGQDKTQFYNGNRLSFEPSTNDKDDKDQGQD